MLHTTSPTVLATPHKIGGSYLSRNHMPVVARARIALSLLRGDSEGVAIARAFQRASPEEQIVFVRAIGSEELWNVLTKTL
jgi:hypothetical protein